MSKHLIKIESTPHGVLGVRHAGLDQQYCEAGELVIIKWQPDAKWGLQEAHYTDSEDNVTPIDLTPVKVDGRDAVVFTMPDDNITVGGTFKRFVIQDWTNGEDSAEPRVFVEGANGEPVAMTFDAVGIATKEVVYDEEGTDVSIVPRDNTIHNCGELETLDIELPEDYGVDFMSQINFTSGATPTTLTDDGDINWLGDDVDGNGDFVPAASKRYVVLLYSDGVDMRGVVTSTTPLA